jgi:hypothetical protein
MRLRPRSIMLMTGIVAFLSLSGVLGYRAAVERQTISRETQLLRTLITGATSFRVASPLDRDRPLPTEETRRVLLAVAVPERRRDCRTKGVAFGQIVGRVGGQEFTIWLFTQPRWLSWQDHYYELTEQQSSKLASIIEQERRQAPAEEGN